MLASMEVADWGVVQAIRLLNHQSWQSLGTFTHAAAVDDASCPDVVVYQQACPAVRRLQCSRVLRPGQL